MASPAELDRMSLRRKEKKAARAAGRGDDIEGYLPIEAVAPEKEDPSAEGYDPIEAVAPPDPNAGKAYRGREKYKSGDTTFRMPPGLSIPQRREWKKSIDDREETTNKSAASRTRSNIRDTAKGMGKSAQGFVEPFEEGRQWINRAARDPEVALEAGDFIRRVGSGDRESRKQLAEGASMAMVEPAATLGDVAMTKYAAEEGKYGEAALYGASVLLPWVSAGWLKRAMRAGEIPPEAAKKVAELEERYKAGDVTDEMQIRRELAGIEDAHVSEYNESLAESDSDFWDQGPEFGASGKALTDVDNTLRQPGESMADYKRRLPHLHPETPVSGQVGGNTLTAEQIEAGLKDYADDMAKVEDMRPTPGTATFDLEQERFYEVLSDIADKYHPDIGYYHGKGGAGSLEFIEDYDLNLPQPTEAELRAMREGTGQYGGDKPPGGGSGMAEFEAKPGTAPSTWKKGGGGANIKAQADEIQKELEGYSYTGRYESGAYLEPDSDEYEEMLLERLSERLRKNPEVAAELRRRAIANKHHQDWEEPFDKIGGFDPNEYPLPKGKPPGAEGQVTDDIVPQDMRAKFDILEEGWGGDSKLTNRYISEMQDKAYGEIPGKLPTSVYLHQLSLIQEMGAREARILIGDIKVSRAEAQKIFADHARHREMMVESIRRGENPSGEGKKKVSSQPSAAGGGVARLREDNLKDRPGMDLQRSPKFGVPNAGGDLVIRDLGPLTADDSSMLSFEQKKYNLSDAELRELRDEMGSRGYDDIVDQARDLPPDRMPRYGDLGGGSSMFDDFMDDLRRISKEQDQFEISGTEPRGILPDRAVLDELQELDNLMGQSDSPLSARQINQRRAAIMDDFYTKNPQLGGGEFPGGGGSRPDTFGDATWEDTVGDVDLETGLRSPTEAEIQEIIEQGRFGDPTKLDILKEDMRRMAELDQGAQVESNRVRNSRTPPAPGASGKIPEGTSRAAPKGTRRERPKPTKKN